MRIHHVQWQSYKPCRIWKPLGTISENDTGNLQKAVCLSVKVDDVVRRRQNKPLPRRNYVLRKQQSKSKGL